MWPNNNGFRGSMFPLVIVNVNNFDTGCKNSQKTYSIAIFYVALATLIEKTISIIYLRSFHHLSNTILTSAHLFSYIDK